MARKVRQKSFIRVVSVDARNATCWREPKQKQSWTIFDRKVEWISSGTNNPNERGLEVA